MTKTKEKSVNKLNRKQTQLKYNETIKQIVNHTGVLNATTM